MVPFHRVYEFLLYFHSNFYVPTLNSLLTYSDIAILIQHLYLAPQISPKSLAAKTVLLLTLDGFPVAKIAKSHSRSLAMSC